MASVTSLGLHEPTALQYAIQEQLLPPDAPRSDYSWDITVDHDGGDAGEDELLVTKDAVIWSRGNIFRKCFGFKLEKEPVTQALLAYFPTSGDSSKHSTRRGPARRVSADGRPLSKALMVILKTQAHIYFLDGTSHVVHMPFEVESASAAPQGVVIQRKQRHEIGLAASIKFPKVPPNSFISLQASPASMRTSLQTTFSTETLGRPKTLPPRLSTSTLEGVWGLPTENNDSSWPRLVTMIDPLLELGLVVTQPDRAKQRNRRNSDKSPTFLEKAEEILHIESVPLSTAGRPQSSAEQVVLAVTINRESCMYTVWKFTYIRNEDPFRAPKSVKKKTDRRRSSMQPGHPSGVTSALRWLSEPVLTVGAVLVVGLVALVRRDWPVAALTAIGPALGLVLESYVLKPAIDRRYGLIEELSEGAVKAGYAFPSGHQTGINFLVTDERHVGRLRHRVRRLDHRHQPPTLDHPQCFHPSSFGEVTSDE